MIALPPGFYDPDTRRLIGPLGRRPLTLVMDRILLALIAADGRPVVYSRMVRLMWPRLAARPKDPETVVQIRVYQMRSLMLDVGIARCIETVHRTGYFLAPRPVAPAIAGTDADRAELRALLTSHPERERAEALLARLLA